MTGAAGQMDQVLTLGLNTRAHIAHSLVVLNLMTADLARRCSLLEVTGGHLGAERPALEAEQHAVAEHALGVRGEQTRVGARTRPIAQHVSNPTSVSYLTLYSLDCLIVNWVYRAQF